MGDDHRAGRANGYLCWGDRTLGRMTLKVTGSVDFASPVAVSVTVASMV
jgi:hypothetical protein